MDGTSVIGGGDIQILDPGWSAVGTGDYNGDGKSDILLQNGQQLAEWQMDGTHIVAADYTRVGPTAVGVPGPDWHIYEHRWDIV